MKAIMSRDFSGPSSWFVVQRLSLAAVAVFAMTSSGFAEPVALVESVAAHSAPGPVKVRDFLEPGQIIQLGPNDTIELRYVTSCVRETITGGIVIIGVNFSEVQAGKITRTGDCGNSKLIPSALPSSQYGGRTFRDSQKPPTIWGLPGSITTPPPPPQ
jgi:hypothetical protein